MKEFFKIFGWLIARLSGRINHCRLFNAKSSYIYIYIYILNFYYLETHSVDYTFK